MTGTASVQAPLLSQSLYRYSYVMNNPLSLIDPSGYSWLSKALKSVGNFLQEVLAGDRRRGGHGRIDGHPGADRRGGRRILQRHGDGPVWRRN